MLKHVVDDEHRDKQDDRIQGGSDSLILKDGSQPGGKVGCPYWQLGFERIQALSHFKQEIFHTFILVKFSQSFRFGKEKSLKNPVIFAG